MSPRLGAQQPLHGGKNDQGQQRRNGMQLQIRLDPVEVPECNARPEHANDQHAKNRRAAPLGNQSRQAQDVQSHWDQGDAELSSPSCPAMIAGDLIYYTITIFLAKADLITTPEPRASACRERAIDCSKESQRPDFDAFARPRAGWRSWIIERGVCREARSAILQGIINLKDKRLLTPHQWEPVPMMVGIVGDRIRLPDAVGVAALRDHEIIRGDTARVTDGKRKGFDRMADRPPDLHDRKAARQQCLGLVWKEIAHALLARPFGVVVVHALDNLAQLARLAVVLVSRAQGVIKNDDTLRPALGLHQRSHPGVVAPPQLLIIIKVDDLGVVTDEAKALTVEHETVGLEPAIVHHHAMRIAGACRPDHGGAWTPGEYGGHHAAVLEIVERGFDGGGRLDGGGRSVLNRHANHVVLVTRLNRPNQTDRQRPMC